MNWKDFITTHYPAGREPHEVDFKDINTVLDLIYANTGESLEVEVLIDYLKEQGYQYQMLSNRVHYMM
jgi:hypothetical protein